MHKDQDFGREQKDQQDCLAESALKNERRSIGFCGEINVYMRLALIIYHKEGGILLWIWIEGMHNQIKSRGANTCKESEPNQSQHQTFGNAHVRMHVSFSCVSP